MKRTEKRKTGKRAKLKKARRLCDTNISSIEDKNLLIYEEKNPEKVLIAKNALWNEFNQIDNYPIFSELTFCQFDKFFDDCLIEIKL